MSELPFTGEEWLSDACLRRCKRNQNAVVACIGPTGSGKSWAELRLAEISDPGFTADRVCFEPRDFIRVISSGLPAGSAVMLDEAGVRAGARNWYKELNKMLSAVFQSFRFLNLIILFSVPDTSMADVHIRSLTHYLIEMTDGIDRENGRSFAKPFIMEFQRNDEPRAVYPVFHIPGVGIRQLRSIAFNRPSQSLIDAYEAKKKAWLTALYEKMGALETDESASIVKPGSIVPSKVNVPPIFSCADCVISFNRKDALVRHYNSKAHLAIANNSKAGLVTIENNHASTTAT